MDDVDYTDEDLYEYLGPHDYLFFDDVFDFEKELDFDPYD